MSNNKNIFMKMSKEYEDEYISFFHFFKKNYKKILIIIFCSLLYAIGQVQFLFKSASMSDGVEAISISLSYIFPSLKPFLTVLYLALNIPLIIFFYKKVKKQFMILTMFFLIFNATFGFILGLEPIDNFICEKIIVIVKDGSQEAHGDNGEMLYKTNIVNEGWPIFVYAILAVAFCSPASAIIWKNGASTGGTDLIAYYISTKKKKDIGNPLVIIGSSMAFLGILTLVLLKTIKGVPSSIQNNINGFQNLVSTQTISTYVYILLNGYVINTLYPKYKKVKIRIDTPNYHKVVKYFESIEFWHPYKINSLTSGYTNENIYSIETVVTLLESDDLVTKLKRNIPDVWVSISPISKIYGRFNYSKVE